MITLHGLAVLDKMKIIITFGIVILLLASIVASKLSLSETEEITTLDEEKFNLTEEEKGKIDGNYNKLGNVIDYQKGTHHTFINFNSGYRVITTNKNFEKMKDER